MRLDKRHLESPVQDAMTCFVLSCVLPEISETLKGNAKQHNLKKDI